MKWWPRCLCYLLPCLIMPTESLVFPLLLDCGTQFPHFRSAFAPSLPLSVILISLNNLSAPTVPFCTCACSVSYFLSVRTLLLPPRSQYRSQRNCLLLLYFIGICICFMLKHCIRQCDLKHSERYCGSDSLFPAFPVLSSLGLSYNPATWFCFTVSLKINK